MSRLSGGFQTVLPWRLRDFFQSMHRQFVFDRSMKKFLMSPQECVEVGHPLLADLVYGWGNESWAAKEEYLIACIEHALCADGPILECGSGLTTILAGATADRMGIDYWALEHEPTWSDRVRKQLEKYEIRSVVLVDSPLVDYGKFHWYSPPLDKMPDSFSLVICDGPPGQTRGGRMGLVPVMKERLRERCVILLDDSGREEEQSVVKFWEGDLSSGRETLGLNKEYVKLIVGDRTVNSGGTN